MSRWKQLLQEIHTRSLWQVLGIYLGASWVVLEVVATFIEQGIGPEWAFPGAIFLLLLGLPVVLVTAIIQKGIGRRAGSAAEAAATDGGGTASSPTVGALASKLRHLFTWRTALLSGVGAFTLLGLVSAGHMAMRTLGIGPVGTLIARGELGPRAELLVADFASADDPELGQAVTVLLRTDLRQSPVLQVIPENRIEELLQLMRRDPGTPLDAVSAREVAVRGGHEAVLAGELRRLGTGHVLTADLVAAESGKLLASFRATAADSTRLIGAAEELSRDLRARVGESLASVRSSPPLPQVTTASLEALRHYATGLQLLGPGGDAERAVANLEAAVEADTAFAMAYRLLSNLSTSRSRWAEFAEKAYRHRERLTERERVVVAERYHTSQGRQDSSIVVLRRSIHLHPDLYPGQWGSGLRYNNLAWYLWARGDMAEAEAYMERLEELKSERGEPLWGGAFETYAAILYEQGKDEKLRGLVERWRSAPWNPYLSLWSFYWSAAEGRYREADSIAAAYPERDWEWRQHALRSRAFVHATRGRLREARRFLESARSEDREAGRRQGMRYRGLELARLRALAGDTAGALQELAGVLEETPFETLAPRDRNYLPLSLFYAELGQVERARELLEQFQTEIDQPDYYHSRPLLVRGAVALAEDQPDVALGHIDARPPYRGYGHAPHDASLIDPLLSLLLRGRAYEAMGRKHEAIAQYRRYLTQRSMHRIKLDHLYRAPVLERLGQLYDERGDLENAVQFYARFVELWKDADPELQPRVEAAQMRLEEIHAARG